MCKPSSVFSAIKPALFYVEERGSSSRNPAGELIIGTAFVIDPGAGLLATAAHVVDGRDPSKLRLCAPYGAGGATARAIATVESVACHPEYDLAVLSVPSQKTNRRPVLTRGVAAVGTPVVVPGWGRGTDLVWLDDIFGYGCPKSITPIQSHGYVAARIPDDERPANAYAYDCTTYPGQSGSPVIDVESGALLAVHTNSFDGRMGYGLSAVLLEEWVSSAPKKRGRKNAFNALLDIDLTVEVAAEFRRSEKDIKMGGLKWRVLKNDPDPLPSNPHAHLLGTREKLHLGTGELFRGSRVIGQVSKCNLLDLRQRLADAKIDLPPLDDGTRR